MFSSLKQFSGLVLFQLISSRALESGSGFNFSDHIDYVVKFYTDYSNKVHYRT